MTAPVPLSVDALLDAGSDGLRFFELFLPLVGASGAPVGTSYTDLCAGYDQQRGLDVDALQADSDRVRTVAARAREEIDRHTDAARALERAWSGDAATSALDLLRRQSARSASDVDRLDAVASSMNSAVAGLRAIMEDKSVAASHFWSPDVGGRDARTVAATVVGAGGEVAGAENVLGTLATVFPTLTAEVLAAAVPAEVRSRVLDPLAAECREWLDTVFLPAMAERVGAFQELCRTTDAAVSDVFAALTSAVADIDIDPYPVAVESASVQSASVQSASGTECDRGATPPNVVEASVESTRVPAPAAITSAAAAGYGPAQETVGPASMQSSVGVADAMVEGVVRAVREVLSDVALSCVGTEPAPTAAAENAVEPRCRAEAADESCVGKAPAGAVHTESGQVEGADAPEPVVAEPVVEEPVMVETVVEEPVVAEPSVDTQPESSDCDSPAAVEPEPDQPDQPELVELGPTQPDAAEPDVAQPELAEAGPL
ncbi:MAG: hypothetical protein WBF79_12265 [Rhodococcus sp. (in: high G+C Gram-positive bacteria)]